MTRLEIVFTNFYSNYHQIMSQSAISSDTELRKLKFRELYTLGRILNLSDSWKKLMAIVPKDDASDLPKFTIDHFSIIEQAAHQQKRNAAEIFLSEWGTMGKKRPTLRTLLNLLIKAELFRAADYVAGDILKEELPQRPKCGPAAPVDISDDIIKKLIEEQNELQEVGCIEVCTFQLPSGNYDNKEINPNIMNKETDNSSVEKNMQPTKLVSTKEKHNENNLQNERNIDVQQRPNEISDLIKFSTEQNMESVLLLSTSDTNNLQHSFAYREVSSRELPAILHESSQSMEPAVLNEELSSSELPVFLKDNTGLSSSISNSQTDEVLHSSDLNINNYEMVSTQLPQCVVELQESSTTNVDNTTDVTNNESV